MPHVFHMFKLRPSRLRFRPVFGLIPVRVRGDSMLPALKDGDRLAVRRLRKGEPKQGQLVVIRESGRPMVKRVSAVLAAGIEVAGDNPSESRDSRHFGPVLTRDIEGVVAFRYWPPKGPRGR
ncbi:MAG: S26 family signal peptidase [Actinomycetota bacterium]